MINTLLTLAALSGRWQVCSMTSIYRSRAVCLSWSPAQEFKLDAQALRFTLLSTRHFTGRARFCHFSESGEVLSARPMGTRRLRVAVRRVEESVLETGGKFGDCAAARASEDPVGAADWIFEGAGADVLLRLPGGKPALLRRVAE